MSVSLKRKSNTRLRSKSPDGKQPSKKKSKSETSKQDAPKTPKSKKTIGDEKRVPVVRLTRRSRTADEKDSADKKGSQKNVPNKTELKAKNATKLRQKRTISSNTSTTKPAQKQAKANTPSTKMTGKQSASITPTRSKDKVDQTEKANTKQKAATTKTDTPPLSRSNRLTRTSTQNVNEVSINVSSRKATPNKTPVETPNPTTTNKKSKRQVASEPPTQKVTNSRDGVQNAASSKTQNEKTLKSRSSLSKLDTPTGLDIHQHRTRRALAKEFLVHNIVTRNRSSVDGFKLLEKLPTTRRKSTVGMIATEKPLVADKSKKKVEMKSSIPVRVRGLRNLEKK